MARRVTKPTVTQEQAKAALFGAVKIILYAVLIKE